MRTTLALLVLLSTGAASAQIQKSGPEQFPGKNELSVHIGYQGGFAGNLANPSGFKLLGEYAHGFTDLIWLDVQLNQVFGFSTNETCYDRLGRPFACGFNYQGGWATEIAVGIKLKIKTGIPLVIEVPITGAVEFLYNRPCNDGGVALPVFRPGGRVMYFLTNRIGLGAGFNVAFGPGFHGGNNLCTSTGNSYTDLYGAFDAEVGAEFIL